MINSIVIVQTNINGIEVNSANTRDIHVELEIKQSYSDWIKYQISKLNLVENIDFTKHIYVVGKSKNIDYIVTTDVAKNIGLISFSKKGQEIRDYFIEIEKQSQKVLTIPEQIILIAQGHQKQDERLNVIEHQINNDIPLTSAQKHNIKQKVNLLVFKLKDNHNLHDDFIPKCYSRVWKKVKNHFIVSSYMEIPKSNFDELVSVVDSITISDVV